MTAEEFIAWRKAHRFTQAAAAEALGLGFSTVQKYEGGQLELPKTVALACEALTMRASRGPREQAYEALLRIRDEVNRTLGTDTAG